MSLQQPAVTHIVIWPQAISKPQLVKLPRILNDNDRDIKKVNAH